jgi:K+-sensing histidine kinase KdpD
MSQCKVVEDLYPLYEENLVQLETTKFIKEHLASCPTCSANLLGNHQELTAPIKKPKVSAAISVKKTQSKLAIYQLLIMILSFYFAMMTNIYAESAGFILTYFILGLVNFLFYRSWLLTFLIAFLPVFILAFYDSALIPNAYKLYIGDHRDGNVFTFLMLHLFGAAIMAMIHTVFTVLGAIVAFFITKLRKGEIL